MGGATLSMYSIIERLDPNKFSATVLFLGGPGDGVTFFKEKGIKVYLLNGISTYAHSEGARFKFISRNPFRPITAFFKIYPSSAKVYKFLNESDFDIVHLNTSLLIPVGIAAKKAHKKVVWHIREPLIKGFFGLRRYFIRNCIKKNSDRIIAISNHNADRLGKTDKVKVIYNYVDFNKFDKTIKGSNIREDLSINNDCKLVVNLGGTVHSKGADIFVKAARNVLLSNQQVRFLIVGYPPQAPNKRTIIGVLKIIADKIGLKKDISLRCCRLIRRYQLQDKVKFIGVQKNIPLILAASDILVWSATVPHFARPIIEAGAMGVPVVASDFQSTREIVKHKESGMLFKSGNSKALSESITILLQDRELADLLGSNGYKQSIEKFNAEKNTPEIIDLYNSLIE